MFNTILVAVDESEAAREAFELACKLALEDHAALLLLNVIDVSKLIAASGYDAPYPEETLDIMRTAGQQLLDERKAAAEKRGITATTTVGEGDAVDEILRVANENDAGLVCIGTHGRQGLARLFIGSVAEGVLRRSEVPVLTVRPSGQTARKGTG
ncbi:MAG: universal stress protein [Candidatus Aquilonibacter sp.]